MEADRRGSATTFTLILAGNKAMRATKRRLADSTGPSSFVLKTLAPAPSTASGSVWIHRRQFRAKQAKNGFLGTRLG